MAGVPDTDRRPPILLLRRMHDYVEKPLSTTYRFLKPWESSDSSPLEFLATHADVIRVVLATASTPVDALTISRLPRLECIVTTSAGLDQVDLAECRRRGVAVANAGTVYSDDAADFAVGMLIDLLRKISSADWYVRQKLWSVKGEFPLGSKLGDKQIGIVGLGSIGSQIARRLEAFGCTISYHSRTRKPSVSYTYFSNIGDLAAKSDVLILSCALNNETKHIVNKDVLVALGKKGIIINIGRGQLIDEKELVRSLKEGEIAGAGLDVFENEPVVPSELFDMNNVILSPHTSVRTKESLSDLVELVKANLEAFFSNKPLISPAL